MSWFGEQEKTYERGMWISEQEWRDQVICQLVYLRNAIYFVGFVIAVTQLGNWLKILDVSDAAIFAVYVAITILATTQFARAKSKANYFEKRSINTTYDDE